MYKQINTRLASLFTPSTLATIADNRKQREIEKAWALRTVNRYERRKDVSILCARSTR